VVLRVVRPERRHIQRRDWGRLGALGLLGVGVYHLSLNYGEHFISANVASLIIASMPVMVVIGSRLVLGEPLTRTKWAGIGLALSGVVVLVALGSPDAEFSVTSIGGAAVTLLAPIAWASYTILSKPLVPRYGALRLTTWAMGVGTLLIAPVTLAGTISDLDRLTPSDWGWLAFLAFGCSTFAYAVWFYALGVLEASQVAVWVYLVPLVALVWAALVLSEPVTAFIAIGGAMVLGGVVLTERLTDRRSAGLSERTGPSEPPGPSESEGLGV
jgi:drug/metabolite transporter (DMT)-like permease